MVVPSTYIVSAQYVLATIITIGILMPLGVMLSVCISVEKAHWKVIMYYQGLKDTQP